MMWRNFTSVFYGIFRYLPLDEELVQFPFLILEELHFL